MQVIECNPVLYPIISAGPDWLTATAKHGHQAFLFETLAEEVFDEERSGGGDVSTASVFGYDGQRASGFFYGNREHDAVIILSGRRAPPLLATVAQAATNVSRLDVQVTVACEHDRPHLAIQGYQHLARSPKQRGRRSKLTLTQSLPEGETLNVNSRRSDAFGRVYDKATEAQIGEARSLWRFEVEYKRYRALHHTRALATHTDPATLSKVIVHDWFAKKGLRPNYAYPDGTPSIGEGGIAQEDRNVLRWFEDSVSVTVGRSINRYGLIATLEALGLRDIAQSERERNEHESTSY